MNKTIHLQEMTRRYILKKHIPLPRKVGWLVGYAI